MTVRFKLQLTFCCRVLCGRSTTLAFSSSTPAVLLDSSALFFEFFVWKETEYKNVLRFPSG